MLQLLRKHGVWDNFENASKHTMQRVVPICECPSIITADFDDTHKITLAWSYRHCQKVIEQMTLGYPEVHDLPTLVKFWLKFGCTCLY